MGAVEQPGGDTFLYLAFTRQERGGTTFLSFELNHDARLWNNGKARIPCRRTGDVQVAYEPQGNDIDVQLRRWVTTDYRRDTAARRRARFEDVDS